MESVPEEYDRGGLDGKDAVEQGKPRLYWGIRGSWGKLLVCLVAERFDVAVEATSCLTTEGQLAYQRGFNDAILKHIRRTFGEGAFQNVLDEVNDFRQKQYQQAFYRSDENAN